LHIIHILSAPWEEERKGERKEERERNRGKIGLFCCKGNAQGLAATNSALDTKHAGHTNATHTSDRQMDGRTD
jgi:hypothetical protein